MSGHHGGGAPPRSSSNAPLDGAFLLQMLRRPPQAQSSSQPQPHPAPPGLLNLSYAFPPHNILTPPRPQPPPPPSTSGTYPGPHNLAPPLFFAPGPFPPPGFLPPTDLRRDLADGAAHGFSSGRGFVHPGEMSGPNTRHGAMKEEELGRQRDQFERNRSFGERRGSVQPGPGQRQQYPRPGVAEQRRPPGQFYRQTGQGDWVSPKGRPNGVERMEEYGRREVTPRLDDGRMKEMWLPGHPVNGEIQMESRVGRRIDHSRDASGSTPHSSHGFDGEEYKDDSHSQDSKWAGAAPALSEVRKLVKHTTVNHLTSRESVLEEQLALVEHVMDSSVLTDDLVDGKERRGSSRFKELRSDSCRGHQVSSQQMRFRRRGRVCRCNIGAFTSGFLSIYESLIPPEEEKAKQKQLLLSLGKLVMKEWPTAQLHIYGSCANSFGVSKSDIDICLALDDCNMSKSEVLLKLSEILQADNFENVQALTRARVPIVKMMDPRTGLSCDICINNLLAVVNTKLLRDYAEIDERLRQLAFIVKHWAKSRGVNETYRGTLSSYAYVLMCIHFLQQRRPAVLPCLQEMKATYNVTVEETECAFFDQVDQLRSFGGENKESIAELIWAFFHYWAYYYDYTTDVTSVRTGRIISKRVKDWTRRIGNDRHLICIEDPFETSHDLGRVVDKFSIKIIREEFERAADILQYDPNPTVTLFELYVHGPTQNEFQQQQQQLPNFPPDQSLGGPNVRTQNEFPPV